MPQCDQTKGINMGKKTNESEMIPKFTKEQLVKSKHFRDNKDWISGNLQNGKLYTIAEVEDMIQKYMKGKVIIWH